MANKKKTQFFNGVLTANLTNTQIATLHCACKHWLDTQLINDGKLIVVKEDEGHSTGKTGKIDKK